MSKQKVRELSIALSDAIMDLSEEKEQAAEIRQVMVDLMCATEQSGIDGALTHAVVAYDRELPGHLK